MTKLFWILDWRFWIKNKPLTFKQGIIQNYSIIKSLIQNPAAPHFRGGVATAGTQSKSKICKPLFSRRGQSKIHLRSSDDSLNLKSKIELTLKQLLTTVLIILTALTIAYKSPALAADTTKGAKIFSVHCAGCHPKGGNIVRRGKNLKKRAMRRNGMDSLEAISSLVANGKNNMSAYKDRLSEKQIDDVAAYVLEQAEKNWR